MNIRTIRWGIIVLVWGFVLAAPGQARAGVQLVYNGDFESGNTGWTLGLGANIIPFAPHSGNWAAALPLVPGGPSLSQEISGLVIDGHYTLDFYFLNSHNSSATDTPQPEFLVTFGAATVYDVTAPPASTSTYNHVTASFMATAATETLKFVGYSSTGYFRVDDVSLMQDSSPVVPEPTSLLLWSSAGLAGIWARRNGRGASL